MLHRWLASQEWFSIKWWQVFSAYLNSQILVSKCYQTKIRVQIWWIFFQIYYFFKKIVFLEKMIIFDKIFSFIHEKIYLKFS